MVLNETDRDVAFGALKIVRGDAVCPQAHNGETLAATLYLLESMASLGT